MREVISEMYRSHFQKHSTEAHALEVTSLTWYCHRARGHTSALPQGWGLHAARVFQAGEMVIEYIGEVVRQQISEHREAYYNSKVCLCEFGWRNSVGHGSGTQENPRSFGGLCRAMRSVTDPANFNKSMHL